MATTRGTATSGLSTTDIEGIRSNLAAGRKPKVVFTEAAGQIAGQAGQVVQLTDPDQSDDWLVVRFGRDELPFSPADLTVPPRGRAGGKRVDPGEPAESNGTPESRPKAIAAARSTPATKGTSVAAEARPAESPPAPPPVPNPRAAATGSAEPPPEPARPAKRATKPARAAKSRAPATMTVTLAYEGGEWTVAAHQGSKTLAKPYLIRPAEALKMVAMLDVPGVHDAVEQIVTAEVTEAQRRADTLRSELAEVEARLAELRDAG